MRNLRLVGFKEIRVAGVVITQQQLSAAEIAWHRQTHLVGIGMHYLTMGDELLMRRICQDLMPFTLFSDKRGTVLSARIKRFPYSINRDLAFCAFTLELWPEYCMVTKIRETKSHRLQVRSEINSRFATYEVGNGTLKLVVYFAPQDPSRLREVEPPQNYTNAVRTV